MIETTTKPRCFICGSAGERHASWPDGRGEMRRCADCDLVFAWPVSQADPIDMYSRAYEGREQRAEMTDFADRLERRHITTSSERLGLWSPAHHEVLEWLEEHQAAGATILEVGFGVGAFMRALRARGYRPSGIDVAQPVVDAALEDGFDVHCCSVDTAPESWPEPAPAAVVSFFTLHHLTDPLAFFRQIRQRWPVPLVLAYNRSPTRDTAPRHGYPPRTWAWWSETSIAKALERSGYRVVDATTQPRSVPQVKLPGLLHGGVSRLLRSCPPLRKLANITFDTAAGLAYRVASPNGSVRRQLEGSLVIVAVPRDEEAS